MHYQDGKVTITMAMLTWKAGRNFCVVPTIDKKLQAISDVRGELPSPRDEHLCQLSCFLKEYIQWIDEINESEKNVNWGLRYRFKTLHDHLRFNNSPHSLVDFNVLNCFHLRALKSFEKSVQLCMKISPAWRKCFKEICARQRFVLDKL